MLWKVLIEIIIHSYMPHNQVLSACRQLFASVEMLLFSIIDLFPLCVNKSFLQVLHFKKLFLGQSIFVVLFFVVSFSFGIFIYFEIKIKLSKTCY